MQGRVWPLAVIGVLVTGSALTGCSKGNRTSAPDVPSTLSTSMVGVTTTSMPLPSTGGASSTTSIESTSSAPPSGGGPLLIVNSASGAVDYSGRQPATIDFSGDATNIVSHITWTTWGPSSAVGNGTWGYDNCVPNCAQATVTDEPATIILSKVTGGHFTAMTERAVHLPAQAYTYPSHWATGAS